MSAAPLAVFDAPDLDFATPSQWADLYRTHGLQVVPNRYPMREKGDKRPAIGQWKQYEGNLVDKGTFVGWYGAAGSFRANRNMGLITGPCSGNIFVLDLDTHSNPDAAVWWQGVLDDANQPEPETWQQVTGGGGRQLFFRAPEGRRVPTRRTSLGVDIRGQGGYAVLPPTVHMSGNPYRWVDGFAPWECEIADAPEWLLDAIDALAGEPGAPVPAIRTVSPEDERNAFGLRIDGREDFMARFIWSAVVDWHRECPIKPTEPESTARMREAYTAYEARVDTRIPNPSEPKSIRLEREGRGHSQFAAKWRAAIGQWEAKVAEAAANPPVREEAPEWASPENPGKKATREEPASFGVTFRDLKAKVFPPVAWIVPDILPEGATILAGRPKLGKSWLALDIAIAVARPGGGFVMGDKKCIGGDVLYLALEDNERRLQSRGRKLIPWGEWPDRLTVATEWPRANEGGQDRIRKWAKSVEAPRLVVVDVLTAFRAHPGANEKKSTYATDCHNPRPLTFPRGPCGARATARAVAPRPGGFPRRKV